MKPAAEMTALEVQGYKPRMRGDGTWPAWFTTDQMREQIAFEQSKGWTEWQKGSGL